MCIYMYIIKIYGPRRCIVGILKKKEVLMVSLKINQNMYDEVRTGVKNVCGETEYFTV